jgi:hypothetical protein
MKTVLALFRSLELVVIRGLICGSLVGASFAQSAPSLDPALQRAVENRKETVGEAQKYTYTERVKNLNFDSKGKVTLDVTDTYEIIYLEGAPYKKHTLHNEQPLPDKEQKKEDKKLADVAKTRREQKDKHGIFDAQIKFELPLDLLATHFDVTANGTENVDGRKYLVFTAIPKSSGADALKQAARDGTAYEMKLWVDQQDGVFTKIEGKVAAEGMRYEKEAVFAYQWKKVNDEAWLPFRTGFKGRVRYLMSDVPVEEEQTFSDYKKFHADSKIISQ